MRRQLGDGIECRCGTAQIVAGASAAVQATFVKKINSTDDDTILQASKDHGNSADWQQFFFSAHNDRLLSSNKTSA